MHGFRYVGRKLFCEQIPVETLAKKFGTTVEAIKRANGLKKSLIREKQVYLIPAKSSRPKPPPPKLSFPARRLPPARAQASAKKP